MPELSIEATNAWAINEFGCKLDECGFWLSEEEARTVVETLGVLQDSTCIGIAAYLHTYAYMYMCIHTYSFL